MSGGCTRRQVVAGLVLAALAGCSESPPARLYTLVPRPGLRIERPVRPVALRPVEIAKYLDRPQIVRHRSAVELAAPDLDRWGEGLDTMVTRVLVENLSLRLTASQVTVANSVVTPQAETLVAIDIARFDPDPDGTVVLEARWTIRRGASAGPVRLERVAAATASSKSADLVATMSDCLAQLSDRLAEAIAG
jgi:uncharacterized protein